MPDLQKWWSTWAPYWSLMEDRHFGTATTKRFANEFSGPVLVVGAGTGLVVQFLKERGLPVDGVDLDPQMIRMARELRSLDIIQADAADLPLEDGRYRTVIIPSGVVDYMTEPEAVGRVLDEARRVLMPGGGLFVGFYRLHPVVEKVNRRIGIIRDGRYHMKRLFDIMTTVKDNPLKCVPLIVRWSGRSMLSTFLYWTRLGMFLPRELKEDRDGIERVLALALKDGVPEEDMVACVPESLPYRTAPEIHRLLEGLGQTHFDLIEQSDCQVVRFHKTSLSGPPNAAGSVTMDGVSREDDWFVRTEKLCKRYDKARTNAVDQLDIAIRRGEIYGILGPNGAGKTTTLSMLSGLMDPDSGRIVFSDRVDRTRIRDIIGYVPQDLALYTRLTGRENLSFFGNLYGVTGDRLQKRMAELLEIVGLAHRADEPIERYSTGMMRRLNLAAGLLHEPTLLLLDEPTVGIDPQSRNCIFEAILELKDAGVTILYTTHYMEEVGKLCDRIAIMDQGRVLIEGEPRAMVRAHGRYRLEFHLDRCPDDFRRSVAGLAGVLSATHSGRVLSVLTGTEESRLELIEEIGRRSRDSGLKLSLRRMEEPSLESLFLDITGKSLKDGAA